MADVHEEPQLGLAHLFGVDVFLQSQMVLLLSLAVVQVGIDGQACQYQIEQIGPRRGIPR